MFIHYHDQKLFHFKVFTNLKPRLSRYSTFLNCIACNYLTQSDLPYFFDSNRCYYLNSNQYVGIDYLVLALRFLFIDA
jgi:hypothetical protein